MILSRKMLLGALVAGSMLLSGSVVIAAEKPNILVIWGDDIGRSNI